MITNEQLATIVVGDRLVLKHNENHSEWTIIEMRKTFEKAWFATTVDNTERRGYIVSSQFENDPEWFLEKSWSPKIDIMDLI